MEKSNLNRLVNNRWGVDLIKEEVEKGSNPNIQEDYGFTSLHETAKNNRIEIVKLLLEKQSGQKYRCKENF